MWYLPPLLCCILAFTTVLGAKVCSDPRESDYRGCVNEDFNGVLCQKWSSESPYKHNFGGLLEYGIGDHNFCRNPDPENKWGAWCYKSVLDGGSGWAYCDVNNKTNCWTSPTYDPMCSTEEDEVTVPEKKTVTGTINKANKNTNSPKIDPPRVQEKHVAVTVAEETRLILDCDDTCTTPQWNWNQLPSRLGVYTLTNGSLLVVSAAYEHAGMWKCSCGYVSLVAHVTVIPNSSCVGKDNGCMKNVKDGHSYMTKKNDQSNEVCYSHIRCYQSNEVEAEKADNNGNSEAIKVTEERNTTPVCSGAACGFCKSNPVMCGVVVFCVLAISVVIAVYFRQSFRWNQVEERLKYALFHENTPKDKEQGNNEAGVYKIKPKEPYYEKASKIQEISLAARLTQHPSTPSLHTNLRRITSDEIGSKEDIVCRSMGASSAFVSEFADDEDLDTEKRGARPFVGMYDKHDGIHLDGGVYTQHAGPHQMMNVSMEGIHQTLSGVGTVFDKYYDQNLDTWSVGSAATTQI